MEICDLRFAIHKKMSDRHIANLLVLPETLARRIEQEGIAAYPNECCGILLGQDTEGPNGKQRIVQNLEPVVNEFETGEQYHRFLITPQTLMRADKAAAAEGKLVLGFYHSHPDHPARPSEYDRQHAWPFYSYVIVSIAKREPVNMTSWLLDEATETFARQDIIVEQ